MCPSNFRIFRSSSPVQNRSPVLIGKGIKVGLRGKWRRRFPKTSTFAGSGSTTAGPRTKCAGAKKAKKGAKVAVKRNKSLSTVSSGGPRAGAGLICVPRG